MEYQSFDRDISWLAFNNRVLEEARREDVPLLERFNFLAIYSSNLDEFYRVRIPTLMALHKISKKGKEEELLNKINEIIETQQTSFGNCLLAQLIPALRKNKIELVYNSPVPSEIKDKLINYFFFEVAAFIRIVHFKNDFNFFPENNRIYFFVSAMRDGNPEYAILNIPSNHLPRFYTILHGAYRYLISLDDIIRENLASVFPHSQIIGCWSFKVTRDAELGVADEYEGDIAERIEKQIAKRDFGLATRVLYDDSMPHDELQTLLKKLKLQTAYSIVGGRYHNLKDLGNLPVNDSSLHYDIWEPRILSVKDSLFHLIEKRDILLCPPYQSFNTILRLFNEAVLDEDITEIYITLYRIAHDSHIAHALISAAKNGKKVVVFVELMARFDEANNLHWAKEMKKAGAKIIYSIPGMKVHAKLVLFVKNEGGNKKYIGIVGTGNLNESTAKLYTDYILMTANNDLLTEMDLLFQFLTKREIPHNHLGDLTFNHLLVAQFNLQQRLIGLINYEADQAKSGRPASIIAKLNNLEDPSLIKALYHASDAGVKIELIVRGICCLVPGVAGLSEKITVHRIVDRYLEHGRIYLFYHGGEERMFIGSADWMQRNMYQRLEVCTPVYDEALKSQLKKILTLQLSDNVKAVLVNDKLENIPIRDGAKPVSSQRSIYEWISNL